MKKIIYYVATSLDGYIAGPNDDISMFSMDGKGVDQYLDDLQAFAAVIMGRRTYEFGYKFGLQPGQPAYPHMDHYIFSTTLQFEEQHAKINVLEPNIDKINELRHNAKTDIYLCGGGEFAGWLLDHDQIDQLKLKINPIVLGNGIRLFGNSNKSVNWVLTDFQQYKKGPQIATYVLDKSK
ncbi:MAG: dihydrofolate reductase [Saprospiraceae bacterium]|nr:dihydrofolate reductase [Saprospiraceae bacterium]